MNIIGWLNPIKAIADGLAAAYAAKLAAKNDGERIEADKQIAYFERQMDLAQTAAEHDRWYQPRPLMAYGATAFVLKLFVWDTVLGWGVTLDPGPTVTGLAMIIVGFYFGSKALGDFGARLVSAVRK